MSWALPLCLALAASLALAATYGSMRNGSFDEARTYPAGEANLEDARKVGWKLPDDRVLPAHWGPNPNTPNGSVEYLRQGGMQGTPAVRLDGGGHLSSYFGPLEPGKPYLASVHVKGHGKLWYGAYLYGADGFIKGRVFIERDVQADHWVEYRAVFPNEQPEVASVNPAISATGGLAVDDVLLALADPADVEMANEMAALYGTGALVENLEVQAVQADEGFARLLARYRRAAHALRVKRSAVGVLLYDALQAKMAGLEPHLQPGAAVVARPAYNDVVVLTRVLERLVNTRAGALPGGARPAASPAAGYKPGVRPPRPDKVTITDIRSNKVLYAEGETAQTRATLVSRSAARQSGTLIARMHLDVDTVREIARAPFAIGPGEAQSWSFSYNVGPETYGRGIEVRFVDEGGRLLDSWQEHFAVAAEWFRVHQHTNAAQNKLYDVNFWVTYLSQSHWFASEPTDFAVRTTDAAEYLSGQAGYRISQAGRKAQMDYYRAMGVKHTFYQTFAFCGPMGYEEMRRHPEYVLYDENGQPAVDPIYGGYPNPMELASPLEMGPGRKAARAHLDRTYTPWQHCAANFAREDAVRFQTERIREYAREHGFDGIYIDGNMGVLKGYGYDGRPNVPSGREADFARLSARNHRIFSQILKRDNPNFGTWYNWGYQGLEWARSVGLTAMFGSGEKGDVSDENIRAATAWKNVMILMETGSFLQQKEGLWSRPGDFLRMLIEQRDFAVQKWGANSIIGYSFIPWKEEEPGPAKWAWPTMNYLGAQLIATQTHHAGGFLPSLRPWLQFQTRYSRLLWARDVRVLPHEENVVSVASPEKIWWRRLVYRRGNDLLVHLVRIPPTPRWDYQWVNEPAPLKGVRVAVSLGKARLRGVQALRPYHFEEDQQPVQKALAAAVQASKASVVVPPFRYHTLLVFRLAPSG